MSYARECLERYKTYEPRPSDKAFKTLEDFLDNVERKGVDTEDWVLYITSNNILEIEYGDDDHGYVSVKFMPDGSIDYTFKNSEEHNIDVDKLSNRVIQNNKTFRHSK